MLEMFARKPTEIPNAADALPGRAQALPTADTHFVNGRPLQGDVPDGYENALFGMGCFWGAERIFWQLPGVWVTSVGYAGGSTPNATYQEVCSGQTGHNEVVRVVYDPNSVSFERLLQVFWQGHDPTLGMRQGNDRGTQYRSGVYTTTQAQFDLAKASGAVYGERLHAAGHGGITTEILPQPEYYFAEEYHQQYLAKNPGGYCGIGGTGVACPVGTEA